MTARQTWGLLAAIILWISSVIPAYALEILIVDQHGDVVPDAVVSIPQIGVDQKRPAMSSSKPAIMDQQAKRFVPRVLAVAAGREVIFPNSDNIRHHVYSFSEPKQFEIKLYKGVSGPPLLFDKPGLVVVGCNIHDRMLGYIYVSPSSAFDVSDSQGLLQLDVAEPPKELDIWHSNSSTPTKPVRVQLPDAENTRYTLSITIVS